jgi:hypothetical protein
VAKYIDIVFDKFPDAEGANFVEIEDESGSSIRFGTWVRRDDGYVSLRINEYDMRHELREGKTA